MRQRRRRAQAHGRGHRDGGAHKPDSRDSHRPAGPARAPPRVSWAWLTTWSHSLVGGTVTPTRPPTRHQWHLYTRGAYPNTRQRAHIGARGLGLTHASNHLPHRYAPRKEQQAHQPTPGQDQRPEPFSQVELEPPRTVTASERHGPGESHQGGRRHILLHHGVPALLTMVKQPAGTTTGAEKQKEGGIRQGRGVESGGRASVWRWQTVQRDLPIVRLNSSCVVNGGYSGQGCQGQL